MMNYPDFNRVSKYMNFGNENEMKVDFEISGSNTLRIIPGFLTDFNILIKENSLQDYGYDLLYFGFKLSETIDSYKKSKERSEKPDDINIFKEDYKTIQEILKHGINGLKITSKGKEYEVKDKFILEDIYQTIKNNCDQYSQWNRDIDKNFPSYLEKRRKKDCRSYDRDSLFLLKHLLSYLKNETSFPLNPEKKAWEFLEDFARIFGFKWNKFPNRIPSDYIPKHIL